MILVFRNGFCNLISWTRPWGSSWIRFTCWCLAEMLQTIAEDMGGWDANLSAVTVGFPGGASGKGLASQCRRLNRYRLDPWVGKMPQRKNWKPNWHSSILASEIPWTEEPGRLQSMGSKRVGHEWAHVCTHVHIHSDKGTESKQAAAAKSLQSCPTLCDPRDGSPPGSPIPGILQARTLEWVAISFSNAWKWKNKVKSLSCVQLLATPWTAAYQAPPYMGFSRQEYWSGLPLPSLLRMFKIGTNNPNSIYSFFKVCIIWL